MTTEELLQKVRKLEIHARHLSKQLFTGDYHSSFKGQGMSFADVRAYQYGDDIRHIDWNVTARASEPYIKEYQEERELVVMLLVDISGSMNTAGGGNLLKDWATEIAAVIAFAASTNRDKVGLMLFDDDQVMYLPPKKGRAHVLRVIRELVHTRATSKSTDIDKALRYLNLVQRRQCVTFVISDFMSAPYDTAMRVTARQHELIGLHVYNPEAQIGVGPRLVRYQDAEGDSRRLQPWSPDFNQQGIAALARHQQETKDLFARAGADLVDLPMGSSYVSRLHQFFNSRGIRR